MVLAISSNPLLTSTDSTSQESSAPTTITHVSLVTSDTKQTISITGTGFGTAPQTVQLGDGSVDTVDCHVTTPSMSIQDDGTGNDSWTAGLSGCDGTDGIGIYIVSWNDTTIVIGGFGSQLGNVTAPSTQGWEIKAADPMYFAVTGPGNTSQGQQSMTVSSPDQLVVSSSQTTTASSRTTSTAAAGAVTESVGIFLIGAVAIVILGFFLISRRREHETKVSQGPKSGKLEGHVGAIAVDPGVLNKSPPRETYQEAAATSPGPALDRDTHHTTTAPFTTLAGRKSDVESASILSITKTAPTYLVEYRQAGQKTVPLTVRRRVLFDDSMRSGVMAKLNALTRRANVLLLVSRGKTVTETISPPLDPLQTLKDLGKVMSDYFLSANAIKTIRDSRDQNLIIETNDTEIPWELMYDGADFLSMRYYVGRTLVVDSEGEWRNRPLPKKTSKLRIALVIDPTETLPAAVKELGLAEALRQVGEVDVYQGRSVDMLKGMNLFSQGYDIIHFAGHADFDPDNPNESSLGFADGKLKAYHIKEMIEKSETVPRLIFVNACTSARESAETELDYHGYKIKGLASLFLQSGVSAYVGTTWTIFDESAQLLATEFYGRVLRGEPVGMALTGARRVTFEKYPDDLSWASFVLYGDPGARLFDGEE
jgi:hypothetical protein